jgi:hydrogenase nickel incorporation protein HypA/HybF
MLMHELSIADALVRQVESIVAREGAARATIITVEIGAFSGVDPDALSAVFPFVAEVSPATAKATLHIVPATATATCQDCGTSCETTEFSSCAKCGSTRVNVRDGRSLNLRSVEVESDD